jgi:hypothetical protein
MVRILAATVAAMFAIACHDQPTAANLMTAPNFSSSTNENGFDQFGYNYTARNFVGLADGVDRALDGTVWGEATYAGDHLKMNWSRAWDAARFDGAAWSCEATLDNQWNGQVPGGSGEVWHYRIVWVGPELSASLCWREGGEPIWDEFEVILSQGTVANAHFWDVHSSPSGFGGPFRGGN